MSRPSSSSAASGSASLRVPDATRTLLRSSSDDPIDLLTPPSPRMLPNRPPMVASPAPLEGSSASKSMHLPRDHLAVSAAVRAITGVGSGSGSSSSSGSSSASSILSGGRFSFHSGQSSPATSRSNSARDPLEPVEQVSSPPAFDSASAKSQGKRKAQDVLSDLLGSLPNFTPEERARLSNNKNSTVIVSTPPPLEEPIFPLTLYNGAYRFFPHCNPCTSKHYPTAHPPAEAQCPWVVQEGAWGKEAVRCGRAFASPEMLAKHVLLTHCHIDPPPPATSASGSQSQSEHAPPPTRPPLAGSLAAQIPKVPCRYGTCSHRTFTSTEKMRAHVIQVHLLPAFLYLCPFENCRLPHTEQPDTQHKLDGHIDRIHDEEAERLRPFAGIGGIGPKGARFSLLRQIPPSILDKDKGGVQPAAAWSYMVRAAAVSGIDLEAGLSAQAASADSLSTGAKGSASGSTPTRRRLLASVMPEEKVVAPPPALSQPFTGTALNSVELEGALKLNAIEKVGRITHAEIDGHWIHHPIARRPPIPRPVKSTGKQSGSSSKTSYFDLRAFNNAVAQEINIRRAASANLRKITPAERSIMDVPNHPGSSQTLIYRPLRVQPYTSLLGKMDYLATPATPLVPSETMLSLALPPTSSAIAGEVYAARQAGVREETRAFHRRRLADGHIAGDNDDGASGGNVASSSSALPRRQVLFDVYLDRPERTRAVDSMIFKLEGQGAFECVDIPSVDVSDWDWERPQPKAPPAGAQSHVESAATAAHVAAHPARIDGAPSAGQDVQQLTDEMGTDEAEEEDVLMVLSQASLPRDVPAGDDEAEVRKAGFGKDPAQEGALVFADAEEQDDLVDDNDADVEWASGEQAGKEPRGADAQVIYEDEEQAADEPMEEAMSPEEGVSAVEEREYDAVEKDADAAGPAPRAHHIEAEAVPEQEIIEVEDDEPLYVVSPAAEPFELEDDEEPYRGVADFVHHNGADGDAIGDVDAAAADDDDDDDDDIIFVSSTFVQPARGSSTTASSSSAAAVLGDAPHPSSSSSSSRKRKLSDVEMRGVSAVRSSGALHGSPVRVRT
ncbi:hypothetical protein OC842_003306 [Tilletia horrida]|uniref:Uncharacterized protein n=1 Tax=Tilletia horrida TaxID=155126 RepID=A0AAN6GEE5_9BASI|nr:hypothetical protein OC842_003306 [Tilletia horrida]